jgi:transposase
MMTRLDREARVSIKSLTNHGVSKSEVARLLGVTEGAVRYHALRMASGAVDGRSLQMRKAQAFAAAIAHWRSNYADDGVNLSALHDWLIAEHGYAGSLRSVQRYCAKVFPAPAIRVRRRVETPPGAQAQADWAHFPRVVVGGARVDLMAFKMALSHSRKDAIVWALGKDMLSWLDCHSNCFKRLGGVPATVRIDNEKTAIARGAGAWGVINPTYRRYARMLHFHIDACPPRQPQCKGKIERRVRDQRAALDPSTRAWRDLAELQEWTDKKLSERAERLICPATGQSVAETWAQERPLLTPLPETLLEPFDAAVMRKVGADALIAFEGRQYSVPFVYAGVRVEARGCARTVQIYKDCALIASHPRATAARLVIDQAHYDGPNAARVVAPPPLGRMGAKMLELAAAPVARRSLDFYAALAEVAR